MENKTKRIGIIVLGIALLLLLAIPSALAADTVAITSPNTLVYWGAGNHNINWTVSTTDSTNDTFDVKYSTDNSSWTEITTNLSNTTLGYVWAITTGTPADASTYRINVTKANTNASVANVSDTSDLDFVIDTTAPVVAITMTSAGLSGTNAYTYASTLTIDGTMVDTNKKNISAGGAVVTTFTGNVWAATSGTLSAGSNTVTATGYDEAGNSHTASITIHKSTDGTGASFVPPPSAVAPSYQIPSKPLSILTRDGEITGGHVVFGIVAILLLVAIWKWWK